MKPFSAESLSKRKQLDELIGLELTYRHNAKLLFSLSLLSLQIALAAVVFAASKCEENLDGYLTEILFADAGDNIEHLQNMMKCRPCFHLNLCLDLYFDLISFSLPFPSRSRLGNDQPDRDAVQGGVQADRKETETLSKPVQQSEQYGIQIVVGPGRFQLAVSFLSGFFKLIPQAGF